MELTSAILLGSHHRPARELFNRVVGHSTGTIADTNNQAVARLELAARNESSWLDAVAALDALENALIAQPDDLTLLFNRSLALESVGLYDRAIEGWHRYLKIEPDRYWLAEAAEHLGALDRATGPARWNKAKARLETVGQDLGPEELGELVRISPQSAREWAMEELLPRWARTDGETSLQVLRRISTVGEALAVGGGDRTVEETAKRLEELVTVNAPLAGLREAIVQYAEGTRAFDRLEIGRALVSLKSAAPELTRLGLPLALWAENWLGGIAFHEEDFVRAGRLFESLRTRTDSAAYPALAGRIEWGLGMIHFRQGRYELALPFLNRARTLFLAADESENLGAVSFMVNEILSTLGELTPAARYRSEAFRRLRGYEGSWRLHNLYNRAALDAMAAGYVTAAGLLMDRAVEVGQDANDPIMAATALLRRIGLFVGKGSEDLQADDFDAVDNLISAIVDPKNLERLIHDEAATRGRWLTTRDPGKARDLASESLRYYESRGLFLQQIESLLTLAHAHWALGSQIEAIETGQLALDLMLDRRSELESPALRRGFTEVSQRIFDTQISRLLQMGEERLAFEWSERSREVLLRSDPPISTAALKAPVHTLMLEYLVIGHEVWCWSLVDRELSLRRLPRPSAWLRARVHAFIAQLRSDADHFELGSELFRVLIEPELRGAKIGRIVVVADAFLNGLPWEALSEPGTREMILEHYELLESPSFGHYLSLPTTPRASITGTPLFVANSLGSREEEGFFPSLPSVRSEMLKLKTLYPEAQFLIDEDATRTRLLEALPGTTLFQFSGHTYFNPISPMDSFLLLAGPDRSTSRLTLRDLLGTLTPEIVLLASCESLASPDSRLGAASSLAFPFLQNGTQVFIGSRWQVDDRETAAFVDAFHRLLAERFDAIAALHGAKRQLAAKTPRSTSIWAAFVPVARHGAGQL